MHFIPAHQRPDDASTAAWHFIFVGKELAVPEDPGPQLALKPMPTPAHVATAAHYLGLLDGQHCWALEVQETPPGCRTMPLRAAMMQLPPELAALAGRAAQVLEWDRTHRYCGVCGTLTELQSGERSRRCPACGHTAYPRISPAMMALVWRPGELLLARAPHFISGMYSALAGFVEPGETLEECVAREVAEEVGVRVKNLRYFGSQSWPFPHSLMVAFTAEWAGGKIVPQPEEIEHAAWYPWNALPDIPPLFSISGFLIRDMVAQMSGAGEEHKPSGP